MAHISDIDDAPDAFRREGDDADGSFSRKCPIWEEESMRAEGKPQSAMILPCPLFDASLVSLTAALSFPQSEWQTGHYSLLKLPG